MVEKHTASNTKNIIAIWVLYNFLFLTLFVLSVLLQIIKYIYVSLYLSSTS